MSTLMAATWGTGAPVMTSPAGSDASPGAVGLSRRTSAGNLGNGAGGARDIKSPSTAHMFDPKLERDRRLNLLNQLKANRACKMLCGNPSSMTAWRTATPTELLTATMSLAQAYNYLGEYESASTTLSEGLALTVEVYGEGSVQEATCLQTLAAVYMAVSTTSDRAIPLLETALSIYRTHESEEPQNVIECLNSLSVAHHIRGHVEKADALQEEALATYYALEHAQRPEDTIRANTRNMLGQSTVPPPPEGDSDDDDLISDFKALSPSSA